MILHSQSSTQPVVYPDSDGQPMSDNTKQFNWITKIKDGLEALFKDDANVFVAGDLLWYPVEGNNVIRRAPDAMVVFGRPKGDRGSYKQWEEANISPQVVFEVLSPGNTLTEMAKKLQFYERYGVEEYYLYDPDRIDFSGWLRSGTQLEVIEEIAGWVSPRLGVRFELTSSNLEIIRPDGRRFLSYVELEQEAEAERQQREKLAAKLRELGVDPDSF
ncbi:MAG: Uma2 family endonuclease [Leptolyngbyaceae cyanobacterium CRU_2_3]|nr:Uma2 family endonuclease [Leptolyngbyaceae cyanobacterium CRU_2_3]